MTSSELLLLEELTARACRARSWDEAAEHRERYLATWRETQPPVEAPVRAADEWLSMLRKLGHGVATMHDKGFTHGTLLLENISPDGALRNFGATRAADPELRAALDELSVPNGSTDAEARWARIEALVERSGPVRVDLDDAVDDLCRLRHQLTGDEWAAFSGGYGSEAGSEVLARVEQGVGRAAVYPALALRVPALSIRLVGHLLQLQGLTVGEAEASVEVEPSSPPVAASPAQPEDVDDGAEPDLPGLRLPDSVVAHLQRRDWIRAAGTLRMELDDAELREPDSESCAFLAASYAMMLLQCEDFLPNQRKRFAGEVETLIADYGERIRSAVRAGAGDVAAAASNANNLGWAAVRLAHYVGDSETLLREGTALLEAALDAASRMGSQPRYSIYANNLAMACRDLSRFEEAGRVKLLHRAADLMREVQSIDRKLLHSRKPAERAIGESLYIDLSNLARVYLTLADETYDATWINTKPVESARWYREALDCTLESREFAAGLGRLESVADADLLAAEIYLRLCRHYVLERRWAGGDVTRAFYDWLCEFAGGWVDTQRLIWDCAAAALEHLRRAAAVGMARNPGIVIDTLDTMAALWALAAWKDGVPGDLGRHAMLSLLQTIDRLRETGFLERHPDQCAGMGDLRAYVEALVIVDGYRTDLCGVIELARAWRAMSELAQEGSAVARALARPYRTALQFEESDDGLLVNGLAVQSKPEALELRIASLRRDLSIGGLTLLEAHCELTDTEFLKALSAQAIAHLQPMMNWGDLPECSVVFRGTALAGRSMMGLEVARLPTGSWATWLLRVATREPAGPLRLSFPFIGVYDRETGKLDERFPAVLERSVDVLVFGTQGVTLEIAWVFPDEAVPVSVAGERTRPEISIGVGEVSMLLKSTPRITNADVFYLVSSSDPDRAACCAASFNRLSPSIAFPAAALQSYAPLFYFSDGLSPEALTLLHDGSAHEIVLVGLAAARERTVELLSKLFDPRRELLWFVDETEIHEAIAALAQFRARIDSLAGSRHLLASAASVGADYFVDDYLQLFCVPGELTATSVQMALDIATLRRWDAEAVPLAIDGRITYLNLKGNSMATRLSGSFRGPATYEDLADRYAEMLDESPMGTMVIENRGVDERVRRAAMPRLPARPVMLFAPGEADLPALVPYARVLGALMVPATTSGLALLRRLHPSSAHASAAAAASADTLKPRRLPGDVAGLAKSLQEHVRSEHEELLTHLEERHPQLLPNRSLLEEMKPAHYLVVAMVDASERAWAYVAANYAASVRAPLYILDAPPESTGPMLAAQLERWRDQRTRGLGAAPSSPEPTSGFPALSGLCRDLESLEPTYIGFLSPRPDCPLELSGEPPLGIRFAIGRLAGPDLDSTCLLAAQAALNEELDRSSRINAIVAESHDAIPDRCLTGAREESEALAALLRAQSDVDVAYIHGAQDRSRFLELVSNSNLVHFAGHGEYSSGNPQGTGLVFREGILDPDRLGTALSGHPIVFANACETGRISGDGHADASKEWSGLAASFIHRGAVNYLGSLWPVFDDGSRRFAEVFYREICSGSTVGEAALHARAEAYGRGDMTWAAFALFGCPRLRLRPTSSGGEC